MDRFLMCCSIMKNQLQLLGTVCMLLASKLRESKPLAGETLVYYTDHSVTKQQLWVSELHLTFFIYIYLMMKNILLYQNHWSCRRSIDSFEIESCFFICLIYSKMYFQNSLKQLIKVFIGLFTPLNLNFTKDFLIVCNGRIWYSTTPKIFITS